MIKMENKETKEESEDSNQDNDDDENDDDDYDVAAPPPDGMYDPSEYEHLNVSMEIKDLFTHIM